jgi:hypothetical protein
VRIRGLRPNEGQQRGTLRTMRWTWVWLAMSVHAGALAQDVDLLHAVEADVAVSSAYRGQRTQADALVDGNLESAWNSRTGELAGAWIEVRVPADARVTSIQMTAGFTRMQGTNDLFTGNHRIARVRVSREGSVIGEHALDVESRALQTLRVSGAGGVYRIEVIEVRPGSRANWRETCVSELRVMGSHPQARDGERVPRTAIGALPPPRAPLPPADPREIERLHRQRVAAIERSWLELEDLADGGREGSAPDEDRWPRDVAEMTRIRRAVMRDTATLVERVDPVAADALRAVVLRAPPTEWGAFQGRPQHVEDLAALARAMDVLSAFLNDDAARCRWARALGHIHLRRVLSFTRGDREHGEMDESMEGIPGGRRLAQIDRAVEPLEDAEREWSRNTRGMAARVGRITLPESARGAADLAIVRAQIEIMRTSCGWPP